MTLIDFFSSYTSAQKDVAWGFIACGLGLLGTFSFLALQSALNGPLWQGVRVGALISGLMILLGGIAYLRFCDSSYLQISSVYQDAPQSALHDEMGRMAKVVADYRIYQLCFAFVVLVALVAALFASKFWAGIAYPFAFQFLALLLIEAHSHASIVEYASYLENEVKVSKR